MRQVSQARNVAAFLLSLPLAILLVAFDLIKLPLVIVFFAPLFGLLDVIAVLRGDDSLFIPITLSVTLLGMLLWFELIGYHPKWAETL